MAINYWGELTIDLVLSIYRFTVIVDGRNPTFFCYGIPMKHCKEWDKKNGDVVHRPNGARHARHARHED